MIIIESAMENFGFQKVNASEKEGLVRNVFNSVNNNYDIMNDLMSFGTHRIWKNIMVEWLAPRPSWKIIDVAGGTGDIALRILHHVKNSSTSDGIINVCDINESMINNGRNKAINQGVLNEIKWTVGNAQNLPFSDMGFDAYTIAFGLRNVTNLQMALQEAYRVLKPGGRFMCLEFSKLTSPILDKFYDFYSFSILPNLGKVITGDKDAYKYLVESIRLFPDQSEVCNLMEQNGFKNIKYRNLSNGIVAIHSGWKY